jgi:phosphoserine phosphatase RsbX
VAHTVTAPACVEWAWAGRPFPGETASGDLAVHAAVDGGAVLAVIDGLGHGSEAALAAERAGQVIEANTREPIDAVLSLAHDALARTRGVAVTIASVGCDGGMRWVGVGNVEAHVLRHDGHRARRVASAVLYGGVVGYRLPGVRVSTVELVPGDVVLMATDGIEPDFTDHVAVADPLDRLVATVVEHCARSRDDALVAAARYLGAPA